MPTGEAYAADQAFENAAVIHSTVCDQCARYGDWVQQICKAALGQQKAQPNDPCRSGFSADDAKP